MSSATVFRAKPSLGWLSWSLLAVVMWAFTVPLLVGTWGEVPWPLRLIQLAIVGLGLFFVLLGILQPSMRYELAEKELVARFGFLLTYRIPYSEISSFEVRDLTWSLWSSMRMPGLAAFKVPYWGEGQIMMCSTRSAKGVLVIDTSDGRYGISPAEEERFLDELARRVAAAKG